MKITPIVSCCVGWQFYDLPYAHSVMSPIGKDLVIELLTQAKVYVTASFLVAYINVYQDTQLSGIFTDLGWEKHPAGARCVCWIIQNPYKWFEVRSFHGESLNNLIDLKLHQKENHNYFKRINAERLQKMKETKKERDKFFKTMLDKYQLTQEELLFLGRFK